MRAPVYADLIRLAIESDGTNVRVAVTVHGTIPNPTPASEQMAIGVDLFRSQDAVESEYQLYASGNDAGWSAFLDTPDGFVRYPGTLQIGGDRLVFTVPWSSVGGLRRGFTRAFLDWDRKGAVLSDTGEDHAPDSSKLSYD